MPCTKYFCVNANINIQGMTAKEAAAICKEYLGPTSPWKYCNPTETICFSLELIKTYADTNSFHAHMKVNKIIVIRTGFDKGKIIL